jgi:tellurite resistance-related uncharacterized protein
MMDSLPEGLESYKRTPTFTEASVPAGLLNEHATKEGTWGVIHIEEGSLRYVVTDPRRSATERIVTPDSAPGIIEPTVLHHVETLGSVRFHVEFLRAYAT